MIWRVCYVFAYLHSGTACYPERYPDEETCKVFGRAGFELVMDRLPGATREVRNRIWKQHYCERVEIPTS